MVKSYRVTLEETQIQLLINDNIHLSRNTWDCGRHSNADFELHIILRGSCNIDVNEYRYTVQEQQAILIAPGAYHLPTPTSHEFERLSVSFIPENSPLKEKLSQIVSTCRIYPITAQMDSVCQDILRESAFKEPFKDEMLHSLLEKLLICNFRILKLGSVESIMQSTCSVETYTDRIDDFFEHHMAVDASAEILASELNLSRRQLTRILKQTYGMGFREKMIHSRMDKAAWLLRNTEKPVQEIACDIGYASDAAFYNVFKRHFRLTPSEYRNKSRLRTPI